MLNFLQVAAALAAVLAMVAGAAWLVRRLGVAPGAAGSLVRVRGGASVGTRERIVVVEIADTWLVLGVAPGRVNTLHTLSRPEGSQANSLENTKPIFASWLKKALEKKRD